MSEKILVVEDEPRLAALLVDYLRKAGYDAECLGDGREVVPRVRERSARPDPARPDAAGEGRHRDLQGDPLLLAAADHHGDGAGRGDRPPARAGAGGRRLHLQAVQPPRGRRAGEGGAAARRGAAGGPGPGARARQGAVQGDPPREGPGAHGGGVRAAAFPRRASRADLLPVAADGPDLPRPPGRERPDHRQPREEAAQEDRGRGARRGVDPLRVRRRATSSRRPA